jgi:hypothetical protein
MFIQISIFMVIKYNLNKIGKNGLAYDRWIYN